MTPPAVFLVTDPRYSLEHLVSVIERAATAIPHGALGVQLRDKTRRPTEAARVLRSVTTRLGAVFLVNGDVELAREVRADGVHVPSDGSVAAARALPWFVTAAVHDDAAAVRAASEGADGLLVSPIFATPGKGPARGIGALARATETGARPYALGGVTPENAAACASAGNAPVGVAVLRALLDAEDPAAVARALWEAVATPGGGC